MYSFNCLIIYSIFGFVLESMVYKIKGSKRHSGICYGPVTYVYGFGVLVLNLIYQYFLFPLKINKWLKMFITFLLSVISLSLVEWLGGVILYQLFQVRLWDYSGKSFHLGRYVCLELALVWGIMGTLYLTYLKKRVDDLIKRIPKKLSYLFLGIQIIDIGAVFINQFF